MKYTEMTIELVFNDIMHGIVPFLMGNPGVGKTAMFEDMENKGWAKVFLLNVNQLSDKADLTAPRLVPIDKNQTDFAQKFYPHYTITSSIHYAEEHPDETVLLVLDEVNRTLADIPSALLSLQTERAIGGKKLPENLRLAMTGNDKGNVIMLDSAAMTRVAQYRLVPDTGAWMDWIGDELNPYIGAVLRKNPKLIYSMPIKSAAAADSASDDDTKATMDEALADADESMETFTTPRTVTYLNTWLNTRTIEQLNEMLQTSSETEDRELTVLEETLIGRTGHTDFTLELLQVITNDLANRMNSQATSASPVYQVNRPAEFASLNNVRTNNDLEQAVTSMDPTIRANCLAYALSAQMNYTSVINALLGTDGGPKIEVNTIMQVVNAVSQSAQANPANLQALRTSQAPFAERVRSLLSQFDDSWETTA